MAAWVGGCGCIGGGADGGGDRAVTPDSGGGKEVGLPAPPAAPGDVFFYS